MKTDDLLAAIALGEDSTRQFKVDVKNNDSLASEMAAFANSEGDRGGCRKDWFTGNAGKKFGERFGEKFGENGRGSPRVPFR